MSGSCHRELVTRASGNIVPFPRTPLVPGYANSTVIEGVGGFEKSSARLQREAGRLSLPSSIFPQERATAGLSRKRRPSAEAVARAVSDPHYVSPLSDVADELVGEYEKLYFGPEQRRWVRNCADGRTESCPGVSPIKETSDHEGLDCRFYSLDNSPVPRRDRNLCLAPQYPLTKPQLQTLKQEGISVVHYPLKKRILRLMHKSHWLAATANRWRYGLAAQLRLGFLEVAELGEYDAFLLLEPDIIVFNPFRLLFLMGRVADPERAGGVWFTNGDYHFVHEGLLLFSRLGGRSSARALPGNNAERGAPSPFLGMLRIFLATPVTATTMGPIPANNADLLSLLRPLHPPTQEEGRTMTTKAPEYSYSLHSYPRTDMHPGGSELYRDNGIGAAVLWLLFQSPIRVLRPEVLDRCTWNYYLEYQFRTKARSVGGDDLLNLDEDDEGESATSSVDHADSKAEGGVEARGWRSSQEEGSSESRGSSSVDISSGGAKANSSSAERTPSRRDLVRQFYEANFLFAGRDLALERSKFALLDAAEYGGAFSSSDEADGGAEAAFHAAEQHLSTQERVLQFSHQPIFLEEIFRRTAEDLPTNASAPEAEVQVPTNTDPALEDAPTNASAPEAEEVPAPPEKRVSPSRKEPPGPLFPNARQREWCASAFLRPSVPHAEHAMCLQWPLEVGLEARTDRCMPQHGPPAIIHKMERDLMLYLDFFLEELNHCATFGVQ